jgi:two-component system, NarL family, sensor histidine kinase UhpB
MDLSELLAGRARRLGLLVALALAACLAVVAILNTQSQQRQNQALVGLAATTALNFIQVQAASKEIVLGPEQLAGAVASRVLADTRQLTQSQEWLENAQTAGIAFSAFLIFVAVLHVLQQRAIRQALEPVTKMVESLEAFEAGDLDRRLPTVPLKELDAVSRSFNHLAESLQASISAQQALSKQLLELRVEERMNLARDLHDDLGQALTATAIELEAAQIRLRNVRSGEIPVTSTGPVTQGSLERIQISLGQARDSLRRLTAGLRGEPHQRPGTDLAELLLFWKQQYPGIAWSQSDLLFERFNSLGADEKQIAFRVVQESLTNVFKHSQPSVCRIDFQIKEGLERVISIANDGHINGERPTKECGLEDIATSYFRPAETTGFGIEGMKERVRSIQGTIESAMSSAGEWQVRLVWPEPASSKSDPRRS